MKNPQGMAASLKKIHMIYGKFFINYISSL